MSYKAGSLRGAVIAFVLFFACAMQASAQSWTSLTQDQRNQAIITNGLALLGTTGLNCKDFARVVVQNASNAAGGPQRNIPATQPDPYDFMWYPDPYAIGQSTTMQMAPLGWIIQMRLRSSTQPYYVIPHTAILYSRDANGFTFLDSNWYNDNTVRLHYMTYAQFDGKLWGAGQFSGYYIQ